MCVHHLQHPSSVLEQDRGILFHDILLTSLPEQRAWAQALEEGCGIEKEKPGAKSGTGTARRAEVCAKVGIKAL